MNLKELLSKVNLFFKDLPENFKKLSAGEKVAYGLIVLGVLFILISIILF